MTTLCLAAWFVGIYYAWRAGGPVGVLRALRNPRVPRRYKLVLALCALPIPGPVDELVAALVLAHIQHRTTTEES